MAFEQLHMLRPHLRRIPRATLPHGYRLRSYRPGDEVGWAALFSGAGMGHWTPAACQMELVDQPQFRPDGAFFATFRGGLVGTTTAWRVAGTPKNVGYVHMVAVDPEHRGIGLGRALVAAALRWFRRNGYMRACLDTDDHRLPAIKVYLGLGFRPVLVGPGHRRRWEAVFRALGAEKRYRLLSPDLKGASSP